MGFLLSVLVGMLLGVALLPLLDKLYERHEAKKYERACAEVEKEWKERNV
jgi:hypothetical protein